MRRHLRNPWVWVAAALLFAIWLLWPRPVGSPPLTRTADEPAPLASLASTTTAPTARRALPDFLPPQAHTTIALIQHGGPFPHRQDGSTFGNHEGHLPSKPRGYYREYTVDTPGLDHRGARRIVTGGRPPEVWYYSDDHYGSFRTFAVPDTGDRRQ